MKKTLILAGAALLALVACNKSETVVKETDPGEISFKAMAGSMTKAGELEGTSMPNTYEIYVAATQMNANGEIENPSFFSDEQAFGTGEGTPTVSTVWHAGAFEGTPTPAWVDHKVYWPFGNVKMDFLAYAMLRAKHVAPYTSGAYTNTWQAKWDDHLTDAAKTLTFNEVNTYPAANQVDVLYANANKQTSAANGGSAHSTPMTFKHAQALLIFNVQASVANKITIKEVAFYSDSRVANMLKNQTDKAADPGTADLAAPTAGEITIKTKGTFKVDNSKIDLEAKWLDDLTSVVGQYAMPGGASAVSRCNVGPTTGNYVNYNSAIAAAATLYQLGETLLIPEQDKQKFTITYQLGDNTYYYTFNDLKGSWQAGKKYIYNLNMTVNEIVITESVADFDAVSQTVRLN